MMVAANWSSPSNDDFLFSNRTRIFLNLLPHECATSTIHLRAFFPAASSFFSSPRDRTCGT